MTDKDEDNNAKIRVLCTTKEKGSDIEACDTFNVITEMVNEDWYYRCTIIIGKILKLMSDTNDIVDKQTKVLISTIIILPLRDNKVVINRLSSCIFR